MDSSTSTTGESAVRTPHYSAEVIKLVAETEAAFQQDDFKRARTNVRNLQEIAPNHPRLSFFESFLRRRADSSAAEPAATSASPHHELAQVRNATSSPTKSRLPGGATVSSQLSAARTSPNTATAGQGALAAPAAAHTPVSVETTRTAPGLTAAPATAATAASPSSPATFAGKTLEDYNEGGTSQRVSPSQPMVTPASGSGASLPVTRDARLIKHVSAEYPPRAASRGIEGVVDVAFTVSTDGSVSDAAVVHSDPPDVFNHSAITAVSRWKYEPKTVNGVPVEARIQTRLQFKMDQPEP